LKRHPECKTLEDYASLQPSYEEITEILASKYVLGKDVDLNDLRSQPTHSRDQQHENVLLLHQYMLLYKEISFAMNAGDIGHLETLFPPWIALPKACGKHKYARQMSKFLQGIHFIYPEPLRCAVRYNILVNPTGKAGQFRGADWVVELNNLFTKVRSSIVKLQC